MQFSDGDEIVGPNSYKRIGGIWILIDGEGQTPISDVLVRLMLKIDIPGHNANASRRTRETSSSFKMRPYYYYRESQ